MVYIPRPAGFTTCRWSVYSQFHVSLHVAYVYSYLLYVLMPHWPHARLLVQELRHFAVNAITPRFNKLYILQLFADVYCQPFPIQPIWNSVAIHVVILLWFPSDAQAVYIITMIYGLVWYSNEALTTLKWNHFIEVCSHRWANNQNTL